MMYDQSREEGPYWNPRKNNKKNGNEASKCRYGSIILK